jgi:hypothetical protein
MFLGWHYRVISFTDDATNNYSDEPITSMMPPLDSIFRQDCECSIRFQQLAPPFILKSLLPSIRSILSISEYDLSIKVVGLKVTGFVRRILLLVRFLFGPSISILVRFPLLSQNNCQTERMDSSKCPTSDGLRFA